MRVTTNVLQLFVRGLRSLLEAGSGRYGPCENDVITGDIRPVCTWTAGSRWVTENNY